MFCALFLKIALSAADLMSFSHHGDYYLWDAVKDKCYVDKPNTIDALKDNSREAMSPWSSRKCVGLLDEKPGFEPQSRHQNKIQKVLIRRFPLSRFLAKTLREKKLP